jgi:hypothetical protein
MTDGRCNLTRVERSILRHLLAVADEEPQDVGLDEYMASNLGITEDELVKAQRTMHDKMMKCV